MKTKFLLFAILACVFYLGTPQSSEAQLGNLLKKKKKKKGKTTETPKVTNPVKKVALPEVSDADVKKSGELSKKFLSFFPKDGEGLDYLTIDNHWSPQTMAENLNKVNQKLQLYAGGGVKKFYEDNKADIDRFLKVGLGKYSMNTNERKVGDTWSPNGGSYNYGYQAYEKYKASGGKNYKEENVEKFWNNKGNGMKSSPKGLKATANHSIELAYKEKDKEKRAAIKLLQTLSTTLSLFKELVADSSPLMAQVNTLEKDTKTTLKGMGAEELTKIYINDFHKANAGKIFFSNKPIDAKTANASSFTSSFSLSDNIYAIAYFDASLVDLEIIQEINDGYDEATKTYIKKAVFNKFCNIKVDGSATMMQFVNGDWSQMAKQGYLTFAIKPSMDKADNQGAIEKFAQAISVKSPRTHDIPVEFYFRAANTKGSLSINLAGMNKDQVIANSKKAVEKAKSEFERSKVLSRGLPIAFQNPKLYNHKFPHVSMAQVKQLAMRRYGSKLGKIDAIVVQDGDDSKTQWSVKVNALGTPINRKGPGYFIAFTDKNGKCYHDFFQIYQDYTGGGYSATKTAGYSNAGKATAVEYNCAKKKFAK